MKYIEIQIKDPETNPARDINNAPVSTLAHFDIPGQWSLFWAKHLEHCKSSFL